MYLPCTNNKDDDDDDDDDDGLGISLSCQKISKIGCLLYAGGSTIYNQLLITRSLAWHLLTLGKLIRWQWWLLWPCAVVTKTTDPVSSTDSGTPRFSIDPGTPHPGPVLSTKPLNSAARSYKIHSPKLRQTNWLNISKFLTFVWPLSFKNVMFVCLLSLKWEKWQN